MKQTLTITMMILFLFLPACTGTPVKQEQFVVSPTTTASQQVYTAPTCIAPGQIVSFGDAIYYSLGDNHLYRYCDGEGTTIVVTTAENTEISIANVDANGVNACVAPCTDEEEIPERLNINLYRYDGKAWTEVLDSDDAYPFEPADEYAVTDQYILYGISTDHSCCYDFQSKKVVSVTDTFELNKQFTRGNISYDGQTVAFLGVDTVTDKDTEIKSYLYRFDATTFRQLAKVQVKNDGMDSIFMYGADIYYTEHLGDGSSLACVYHGDSQNVTELETLPAGTGRTKQIATNGKLYYMVCVVDKFGNPIPDEKGKIYGANLDGSDPTLLLEANASSFWKEGNNLYYISKENGTTRFHCQDILDAKNRF